MDNTTLRGPTLPRLRSLIETLDGIRTDLDDLGNIDATDQVELSMRQQVAGISSLLNVIVDRLPLSLGSADPELAAARPMLATVANALQSSISIDGSRSALWCDRGFGQSVTDAAAVVLDVMRHLERAIARSEATEVEARAIARARQGRSEDS